MGRQTKAQAEGLGFEFPAKHFKVKFLNLVEPVTQRRGRTGWHDLQAITFYQGFT